MRILVCCLALAFAGGCGGGGLAPLPGDQIRARFPPGGVVDVIEVDAVDRLPLRSAELLAPDGQATPATSLDSKPAPAIVFNRDFSNIPYGGSPYGSSATGVPSIGSGALLPAGAAGAPQSRGDLLAITSTASIPLSDPVEYRRGWRDFRIRLRFGDPPGEAETREIAAPEPPPGG
jgi:hypothetical protein